MKLSAIISLSTLSLALGELSFSQKLQGSFESIDKAFSHKGCNAVSELGEDVTYVEQSTSTGFVYRQRLYVVENDVATLYALKNATKFLGYCEEANAPAISAAEADLVEGCGLNIKSDGIRHVATSINAKECVAGSNQYISSYAALDDLRIYVDDNYHNATSDEIIRPIPVEFLRKNKYEGCEGVSSAEAAQRLIIGTYNNEAQWERYPEALKNSSFLFENYITTETCRVNVQGEEGYFLYIEQSIEGVPYRTRVYRFLDEGNGVVRLQFNGIAPERSMDGFCSGKADKKEVTTDLYTYKEGCDLLFTREGTSFFGKPETVGGCKNSRGGYSTTDVELTETLLRPITIGYDAQGDVTFGNEAGLYFDRFTTPVVCTIDNNDYSSSGSRNVLVSSIALVAALFLRN